MTVPSVTAPTLVRAAGTVPWRRRRGRLQVALVHRPRYDDWSWAKGKLDDDEAWPVAAVRETVEETGLVVRLGRPLPPGLYTVTSGGQATPKEVRYWAGEVVGGNGALEHEVDQVAWLDVDEARERLTQPRDADQVDALARADRAGALTTWPLALVRHAKARPRRTWEGDDTLRPLDDRGEVQARQLVPLLAAYGLTRLVSSPSVRCTDTLEPYAASVPTRVRLKPGLSEEGFEEDPVRAVHHLTRLLERGTAAALCSHGPVLPDLLAHLTRLVDPASPDAPDAQATFAKLEADKMSKGEALVLHLVGTGAEARIVAVERYASDPDDTD